MVTTSITSFRRPDFNRNLEKVTSFGQIFLGYPISRQFLGASDHCCSLIFLTGSLSYFHFTSCSHTYRKVQKVSVAPLAASQMMIFFMGYVNSLKDNIWRVIYQGIALFFFLFLLEWILNYILAWSFWYMLNNSQDWLLSENVIKMTTSGKFHAWCLFFFIGYCRYYQTDNKKKTPHNLPSFWQ